MEDWRRATAAMERARLDLEAAQELRREALELLLRQGLTLTESGR